MANQFEREEMFPALAPEVGSERLTEVIDYVAEDVDALFEERLNDAQERAQAHGEPERWSGYFLWDHFFEELEAEQKRYCEDQGLSEEERRLVKMVYDTAALVKRMVERRGLMEL